MTDHRHHFDASAHGWDNDPGKIERAQRFASAIDAEIGLKGDERVFEFGAGTGLVSQMLAPKVGQLVLADNSTGMRDVMAKKVAEKVLPEGAVITDVDLVGGERPEEKFDLAVASLVLHHIAETKQVLQGFFDLLHDGGAACIIDLDEDGGAFHEHFDGFDGHHGFNRESLKADLEAAGFREVSLNDVGTLEKHGEEFNLFMAVAYR